MNQINKSKVTLWKNRESGESNNKTGVKNQRKRLEDRKEVESEFIENLKKQITKKRKKKTIKKKKTKRKKMKKNIKKKKRKKKNIKKKRKTKNDKRKK